MSISVGILSVVIQEQIRPYDSPLQNNLVLAGHWQTLLAIIVLLINDAGWAGWRHGFDTQWGLTLNRSP